MEGTIEARPEAGAAIQEHFPLSQLGSSCPLLFSPNFSPSACAFPPVVEESRVGPEQVSPQGLLQDDCSTDMRLPQLFIRHPAWALGVVE